ncbi:MAG: tetratricopeptide repeat protein [Bdellovibrionaceae bacterium]|nr:tetratricopeptide repeat protein [Bdellovibrio sp.]
MIKQNQLILGLLISMLFGCATGGTGFYDSAINDRNRAPATIGIPEKFDSEVPTIDAVHNQAEADFLFIKADLESQGGKSVEAIESLKSALVYDPNAVTLMQKLAVEYYRKGQTRDALYWAEKARALSPDKKDLALLVGGLYTTSKNFTKAEEIYISLIKKDKEDAEAILYLGAVYTEMKNYTKAIQHFLTLTKLPSYTSKHLAHYYLARVLIEQNSKGAYAKAQVELRKSVQIKGDFAEGLTLLGQLIQKEKGIDSAYAFYAKMQAEHGPQVKLAELLSQYYIEKNMYDKAYEQLEVLDSNTDDLVQVKLKMALILIEKKAYDLAIPKLQEILSSTPESDKVRFYLSAVYEEKKDSKKAYDEYMKITKESSYFEDARLHAAYLAKTMGNGPLAMQVLKEAVDRKVENPQTYFLMTQFHEENKNYKKSLEVLKLAEEKFPTNAQVFFYKGSIQDKLDLKEEMITSMKKVLVLDQEHVQAMNYLAFSWAEMGQELEQAEKFARQAALKERNDAFILDTLGWVLFKKGRYEESVTVLEKAYSMQPKVGIIAEHLGDVYFKMNKYDKARDLFLKATENETDAERRKQITTKITVIDQSFKDGARVPASAVPNSK